jgi:ribonuclease G
MAAAVSSLFLSVLAGRTRLLLKRGDAVQRLVESYEQAQGPKPGEIYRARVEKVRPSMGGAFLQAGGHSFLLRREHHFCWSGQLLRGQAAFSLLKEGQSLLVQVERGAEPGKQALVGSQIKLKGHGLILLAPGDRLAFSKRLETGTQDWHALLGEAEPGLGFILRSSAVRMESGALLAERDQMLSRWRQLRDQGQGLGLLWNPDPLEDLLLDEMPFLERIYFEGHGLAERLEGLLSRSPFRPALLEHQGPAGLLATYKLTSVLDSIRQNVIWLRNGGRLEIKSGQALTVFDVNSGKGAAGPRSAGPRSAGPRTAGKGASLALTTNLLAAEEVARQIRLRDLGGLIVIDFIDCADEEERRLVRERLLAGLAGDDARSQVLAMNELGLLEMSRQKRAAGPELILRTECPRCRGTGQIWTQLAQAYRLMDEALEREDPAEPLVLRLPEGLYEFFLAQTAIVLELRQRFPEGVHLQRGEEACAP